MSRGQQNTDKTLSPATGLANDPVVLICTALILAVLFAGVRIIAAI